MSRQNIFLSYSHKDQQTCKELLKHLAPLREQGRLSVWSDHDIPPGAKWLDEINEALTRARVAILLVSPDFLESSFITKVEVPRLLAAAESEGLLVLCAHLEHSVVNQVAFSGVKLTDFQAINPPDRPLASLSKSDRNKTLRDLALTVLSAVQPESQSDSGRGKGPSPKPRPTSRSRGVGAYDFDSYKVLRQVASGGNGDVFKCRSPDGGALCIVKRTGAEKVTLEAQEKLSSLSLTNIAKPTRIWSERDFVYEELPYVGGTRLSDAVKRTVGGLRGCVLAIFFEQMRRVLEGLHEANLVHRDIHPDNIYMCVSPLDAVPVEDNSSRHWEFDEIGVSAEGRHRYPGLKTMPGLRRVSFVLVDSTFVTHAGNSSVPVMHGTFTPLEQVLGSPCVASDYYALGATLFYGIMGEELPSYRERNGDIVRLYPVDEGTDAPFADTIQALTMRDPAMRRIEYHPGRSTVVPHDAGTLELSDGNYLISNRFQTHTRVVRRVEALEMHSAQMQWAKEWLESHSSDARSTDAYDRRRYDENARAYHEHSTWTKILSESEK